MTRHEKISTGISVAALVLSIVSLGVSAYFHQQDNSSRLTLIFSQDYDPATVEFTTTGSPEYPVSYTRHVKIYCRNEGPASMAITGIQIHVINPKRMPTPQTRTFYGNLQFDNAASQLLRPTFAEMGKPVVFPVAIAGHSLRVIDTDLNVGVAAEEWAAVAAKIPVNVEVKRAEVLQALGAAKLTDFGATDKTYRFYLAWITKDGGRQVDGEFDMIGDLAETGGE